MISGDNFEKVRGTLVIRFGRGEVCPKRNRFNSQRIKHDYFANETNGKPQKESPSGNTGHTSG
jgi:hypothetical protein